MAETKVCSNVADKRHTCQATHSSPIPQPLKEFGPKGKFKTCEACRKYDRVAKDNHRHRRPTATGRHIIVRHLPIVPGSDPKFTDDQHRQGYQQWLEELVRKVREDSKC